MSLSKFDVAAACERAHSDSEKFLLAYEPKDLVTHNDQQELRRVARIKCLRNLVLFVADEWDITVVHQAELPKRGFASWLLRLSTSDAIALDDRQINEWSLNEGLCADRQRIRAILHEVGHHHLSRSVMPKPSGDFFTEAPPYEEERAWCYAFAFMGSILGRYAEKRRQDQDMDDSPRIPM